MLSTIQLFELRFQPYELGDFDSGRRAVIRDTKASRNQRLLDSAARGPDFRISAQGIPEKVGDLNMRSRNEPSLTERGGMRWHFLKSLALWWRISAAAVAFCNPKKTDRL